LDKNPERDYASGEGSDFSDLELDPATGQLNQVSADAVSIPIDVAPEVEDLFAEPEPASLLTADRLLQDKAKPNFIPETSFRRNLYHLSFGRINLGDNAKVRARRALDARIGADLAGETKFVPVLTRKGGVGKTTMTALIGMAMARAREDRVLAIDANPDRGTLSERVQKGTDRTVRDVVNRAGGISSFSVFSDFVSRDKSRLDVLSSDADPMISEAFNEGDYNVVADIAARYYSVCLTDCGTGIVHSVMRAVLMRANGIVIVSGGSIDEAKLASETLTWLDSNGYSELVSNSVVALNTATFGTELVKLDEIEAHFASRVRAVVRIPYDPQLAAGAFIDFDQLHPATRQAARDLAALVVDGLAA
jgi:MinD-like ATPase involved in chromosome partitioning or flagellar assembly